MWTVWLISLVDKRVGYIQVKLSDPSLTRAIPERLRDESLVIKRYTNTVTLVTLWSRFRSYILRGLALILSG